MLATILAELAVHSLENVYSRSAIALRLESTVSPIEARILRVSPKAVTWQARRVQKQ